MAQISTSERNAELMRANRVPDLGIGLGVIADDGPAHLVELVARAAPARRGQGWTRVTITELPA